MKNNPNDRCLDGQEQQQERITVKRLANSIKKIEFEIEINKADMEKLSIENEEKQLQIKNLTERRDQGKRLIGGAKISDVFPQNLKVVQSDEPEEASEEKEKEVEKK